MSTPSPRRVRRNVTQSIGCRRRREIRRLNIDFARERDKRSSRATVADTAQEFHKRTTNVILHSPFPYRLAHTHTHTLVMIEDARFRDDSIAVVVLLWLRRTNNDPCINHVFVILDFSIAVCRAERFSAIGYITGRESSTCTVRTLLYVAPVFLLGV